MRDGAPPDNTKAFLSYMHNTLHGGLDALADQVGKWPRGAQRPKRVLTQVKVAPPWPKDAKPPPRRE